MMHLSLDVYHYCIDLLSGYLVIFSLRLLVPIVSYKFKGAPWRETQAVIILTL